MSGIATTVRKSGTVEYIITDGEFGEDDRINLQVHNVMPLAVVRRSPEEMDRYGKLDVFTALVPVDYVGEPQERGDNTEATTTKAYAVIIGSKLNPETGAIDDSDGAIQARHAGLDRTTIFEDEGRAARVLMLRGAMDRMTDFDQGTQRLREEMPYQDMYFERVMAYAVALEQSRIATNIEPSATMREYGNALSIGADLIEASLPLLPRGGQASALRMGMEKTREMIAQNPVLTGQEEPTPHAFKAASLIAQHLAASIEQVNGVEGRLGYIDQPMHTRFEIQGKQAQLDFETIARNLRTLEAISRGPDVKVAAAAER